MDEFSASIQKVDPSWRPILAQAYEELDPSYRVWLTKASTLPSSVHRFRAFETLPKERVRYILFGQDPYPRAASAVGYAFIDGAVPRFFCPKGLDPMVNRATSLRNFIKMALVAEGRLSCEDLSQKAIAACDKRDLIDNIDALRRNFEQAGVLLLNASLVFESKARSRMHVKAWQPFVRSLLSALPKETGLILFGAMARTIGALEEAKGMRCIDLEHPYNHTFVCNPVAHRLFGPMGLLRAN